MIKEYNFSTMSDYDIEKEIEKHYRGLLQMTVQEVDLIHNKIDLLESELKNRRKNV